MKVRYQDPGAMVAWAAAQLGGAYRYDSTAIGLEEAGELRAVVVIDNFETRDCHVSVVSTPGAPWRSDEFARAVSAFIFITAGLPRCTCMIPASHRAARALAVRLGAELEGTKRQAAPDGGDLLMYGLLRKDCRWVPKTLFPTLAKSA